MAGTTNASSVSVSTFSRARHRTSRGATNGGPAVVTRAMRLLLRREALGDGRVDQRLRHGDLAPGLLPLRDNLGRGRLAGQHVALDPVRRVERLEGPGHRLRAPEVRLLHREVVGV